ncbi:MAG: DinB family protein [Candidatus Hydrogenedentes bacterium]|nr:DinB family protein [Candidatus Hydrogenedentota bacterium]
MGLADAMLVEFERSLPLTRTHLERAPQDKLSWRPAPKSMTLGQLALHLAVSPGAVAQMAMQDSVEMPDFRTFPEPQSVAEILAAFDQSIEQVRQALTGLEDARLEGTISFTRQGQAVMSFPRKDFLRDIILNHTYHHRGQLSVYLRLLGVSVPPSFGPTADEKPFG